MEEFMNQPTMLDILKNMLYDGMTISVVSEDSNKYKIKLFYKDVEVDELYIFKTVEQGKEKSYCRGCIEESMAYMYTKNNNPSEAAAWMAGKRRDKPNDMNLNPIQRLWKWLKR